MALLDENDIGILQEAMETLSGGFDGLPEFTVATDSQALTGVLRAGTKIIATIFALWWRHRRAQ